MTRDDPLIGTTIGNCTITGPLGVGGMGMVYAATHPVFGDAAVKVMRPDAAISEQARDRFLREARSAVVLTHRHIVRMYDAGFTADNALYMAMEFCAGGTLKDRLKAGPMPLSPTLPIVEQMLDALIYAHDEGFIHRDVKSDNVLFDAAGRAKLADFGLARLQADDSGLTTTGQVMGTPRYMPIEQWDGHVDLDGRADQYALGVVVYEMLTGRFPVEAETLSGIITGLISGKRVPITERLPGLPGPVAAVIERMTAVQRDDRFADLLEAREALSTATGRPMHGGVTSRTSISAFAAGPLPGEIELDARPTAATLNPAAEPSLLGVSGVEERSVPPGGALTPTPRPDDAPSQSLDESTAGTLPPPVAPPVGKSGSHLVLIVAVLCVVLASLAAVIVVVAGGGTGEPTPPPLVDEPDQPGPAPDPPPGDEDPPVPQPPVGPDPDPGPGAEPEPDPAGPSADSTAPRIAVTSPEPGALLATGDVRIAGLVVDEGEIAALTIGGEAVEVGADGRFAATLPLADGAQAVEVVATDAAGNRAETTVDVIIDTTPPTIVVTTPTAGDVVTATTIDLRGRVDFGPDPGRRGRATPDGGRHGGSARARRQFQRDGDADRDRRRAADRHRCHRPRRQRRARRASGRRRSRRPRRDADGAGG
jgi:serine/threonine protein kinase